VTRSYDVPPRRAFVGITPTGRDNGKACMAGTRERAKVEVTHDRCGYTWWTMDHHMIERVREFALATGDSTRG
jgi:hypothetical protein